MDKCTAMALRKMQGAGILNPELMGRQERAAVRAERELLEVLDTFDDKHLPHVGSRAREAVLSSRGEVDPDSLRLENGDWASAGEYVIEDTDSGAPIQFAKVRGARVCVAHHNFRGEATTCYPRSCCHCDGGKPLSTDVPLNSKCSRMARRQRSETCPKLQPCWRTDSK